MKTIFAASLLTACASAIFAFDKPKSRVPAKPVFTMSKQTTFITEPLEDDGLPDYETALNRILQGKIKPEENTLVRLWDASGPNPEANSRPLPSLYWNWLGRTIPPNIPAKGVYFISFDEYVKRKGRTDSDPDDSESYSRSSHTPWRENENRDIAQWLAAMEGPLAIVTDAASRKSYFNPLVVRSDDGKPGMLLGALMPQASACRKLADALCKRAMLRTSQGKFDVAWKDLLVCHRLGRHYSHGGTLIELQIGIALDSMACRADLALVEAMKPTAKQVETMLGQLDELPAMGTAVDKWAFGERFVMLDSVAHIRRGGIDVLEGMSATGEQEKTNPKINRVLDKMDWDATLRTINT